MNNLLIDDYPILVLPKLATEIGLNEAIVLQQMHYWINKSNHIHDNKRWIYNSYKEWEQHFPFWSNATIRRTISSLEKQELVLVGNYNKAGFDKTKWYSINYSTLEGVSKRVAQNEQTSCSKRANAVAQNEQTNTRDYTENTSDSRHTQSNIYEYITKELENIQNSMQFEKLSYEIDLAKDIEIVKIATDYTKQKQKGINYLVTVLKNWNNEGVDTKEKALAKVTPKKKKSNETEDVFAAMKEKLGVNE
ncbi:DnaD domain protein [Staphylococcus hominis]|uniref:DnaD domain protein n=1 Tax=Staphylococcus hominis TaxID=1290 RepID=UPI00287A01E9|nr:DnaD domain protein [Staphylococcus hominis]MDS3840603.1 DnaD domain protein [Staphylococcus hominis]